MTPEVSIVVPSYSRQDETVRAIRSALRQRDVHQEIVVVDDGSPVPFRLPEALRANDKVRLIRLPRNAGAAAARNEGVARARSDAIAFLDSDDFFLPDTLAKRLAWLHGIPHAGPVLAVAPVWRWSGAGRPHLFDPMPAGDIATLASGCWYFPGSTALFKRSTWERVGTLDPDLRRLEDLDWGIRLGISGGKVLSSAEPSAVIHRSRPAGLNVIRAAAARIEEKFGPETGLALDGEGLRRLRAYLALEVANAALGERAYAGFAAALLHSFLWRPRAAIHQHRWHTTRRSTRHEAVGIAELAQELSRGGEQAGL